VPILLTDNLICYHWKASGGYEVGVFESRPAGSIQELPKRPSVVRQCLGEDVVDLAQTPEGPPLSAVLVE
jgi:hypothetical protein